MRERVAVVSDAVEFAGAERYLVVLAEELRERCELVGFIPTAAPEETERKLVATGMAVSRIEGLTRIPRARPVLALARALRDARPGVVHVNLTDQGDGLGPLAAAVVARAPTVAVLHNVIPGRAAVRERVSRAALRRPCAVVAVSEVVARYVRSAGVSADVIENGLPPVTAAADARGILGLPPHGIVVGGVGRLHRQKGWDVLARAAAIVRARRADARFVVLGEGAERASLAESPHLELLGYREDAAALGAAFDILVVPSRYEAFGLVALEAMQLGVPVVAANVGGLPRVVGDAGVLVPPEDPAALGAALLRLIDDPALRQELGSRGSRRARAEFGSVRMAAETLYVYERVQRRRGAGT